jgi:succinyl-diaminopimelate desuccinylase
MKALRDLGIETNSKFQIFIGSNEESGMGDIKSFVKEQKLPDVNIVPDAGYPAAIGQKGILRFDVRSEKPFEDIVNVSGGTAYNIVLDKVSAKIVNKEGMLSEMLQKKPDCIEIGDGNFITVSVAGVSAHAARAEQGVNALGILANFLLEIDSLSGSDKEILKFVSESLSDVYGKSWGIDSYNDFYKETTCANGIARMVDSCLEYTFDVRHNDVIPPDELVSRIEKYFEDGGFKYKKYSHSVCMKRDENSMPIKTFMDGYRKLTGNPDAKPYVMGGGTYANYLDGGFAIGVDFWEKKPDVVIPAGHGGAHQADEVLCIPNFIDGMALMAELILQIDENLA